MEKSKYERLKSLRKKEAAGTATFVERTILKIEEKNARKHKKNNTNQHE